MNKRELFIFDMDGLLVESGKLAYKAYLRSAKKHNYELVKDVYFVLTGQNEENIRKGMKKIYGEKQPTDEWRNSMNLFKDEILNEEKRVYTRKGAHEFLTFLKDNHQQIALASSNTKARVMQYLEMEGLEKYFNYIVSGDDVIKGKPDPEIFLKACELAGVQPSSAVVFEDSIAGIEAANRAGIPSILIEDHLEGLNGYDGKHKIICDLEKMKPKNVEASYKFDSLLDAEIFFRGCMK